MKVLILLFFLAGYSFQGTVTPISSCTKGRITRYTNYVQGGSCSFGPHPNAAGSEYMYPVSPNQAFFNNHTQCGICYEMIGPFGVIRSRVENYCPAGESDQLCKGDMLHFDTADSGASYLMKEFGEANITFRMVSCDFDGNIKIKTGDTASAGWYNFVVLDHKLGIKSVRAKESGSEEWTELVRENANHWTYNLPNDIKFPITIEIYSIAGDYVTVRPDSAKNNTIYEADGNFKVTNDLWFDVETLEKKQKPASENLCCESDKSDFSPLYENGYYKDSSQDTVHTTAFVDRAYEFFLSKSEVNPNSDNLYNGKKSLEVNYITTGFGLVQIHTLRNYPIRADQYIGVKFALYPTEECRECLFVRASDLQNYNQKLSFSSSDLNKWKEYTFDFETLGVEEEFLGMIFQYYQGIAEGVKKTFYIADIELIPNPNAPDAGVCFAKVDYSNLEDDSNTEEDSNLEKDSNFEDETYNENNPGDDSAKIYAINIIFALIFVLYL